ncbi:MAG: sigma-70 family RNA polymerase sigma factor [Opitutaceae bacterium]|jgi:RNA polymerase sigma-70 factor (ECF subfamily)|nr:sigma-70 family RNA polymerase sigma factor [Opitutaceae bacterium]
MSTHPAAFPDSRFIEALTRHQPVLEAFCHAQLANRADARDVLQETNLKLWEKSASWDPETSFLPWAFAVARFTILSHVRDRMRERVVFDSDVVEIMAGECERAAAELPPRQEALGQCLQKLEPPHRSLLRDHYVSGHSLRDLATSLGRTEGALKMTMMRLRQQLGVCIDRNLKNAGA